MLHDALLRTKTLTVKFAYYTSRLMETSERAVHGYTDFSAAKSLLTAAAGV